MLAWVACSSRSRSAMCRRPRRCWLSASATRLQLALFAAARDRRRARKHPALTPARRGVDRFASLRLRRCGLRSAGRRRRRGSAVLADLPRRDVTQPVLRWVTWTRDRASSSRVCRPGGRGRPQRTSVDVSGVCLPLSLRHSSSRRRRISLWRRYACDSRDGHLGRRRLASLSDTALLVERPLAGADRCSFLPTPTRRSRLERRALLRFRRSPRNGCFCSTASRARPRKRSRCGK